MTTDISINLENLNYYDYISQFEVYPTQQLARLKGYEAHHIVPVSIQWNNYKLSNNSTISKADFKKVIPDDRCLRLTTLQHLIVHYLMAKNFGGDYIKIFAIMYNHNIKKLNNNLQCSFKDLKDVSSLREEGFNKISNERKGMTPWNKGLTNIYSEEVHEKMKLAKANKYGGKDNPSYGKKWFNNGIENIYLDPTKEEVPDGFSLGMFLTEEKKKKLGESATNRTWYTNGIKNIYLLNNSPIPNGYFKGRTFNPWEKRKRKV